MARARKEEAPAVEQPAPAPQQDTAEPAGGQTEDVAEQPSGDAVTAVEAAKASTGADDEAPTGSVSPDASQPAPDAPLGALSTEGAVQAAIDDIRAHTADLETSGFADDTIDVELVVTAAATKTCARWLWLEGQVRVFRPEDVEPGQLDELQADPDFALDWRQVPPAA